MEVRSIRWINITLVSLSIVAIFLALTGNQIIRLMEKGNIDTDSFFFAEWFSGERTIELESGTDELVLTDEPVALASSETAEDDYSMYIGQTGEEIEQALYVVIKDYDKLYGSVVKYSDIKFYIDETGICYGFSIRNQSVFGLDLPMKRDAFVQKVGESKWQDMSMEYYHYNGHYLGIMSGSNYVEEVFVTETVQGLMHYTLDVEGHINFDLVRYFHMGENEILNELGSAKKYYDDVDLIYDFSDHGMKITYRNDEVVGIQLYDSGAYGLSVGQEFRPDMGYIKAEFQVEGIDTTTLDYKVNGLRYSVIVKADRIIAMDFVKR